MSTTITRVAIDGTDLPFGSVVYALSITHGRSLITDGPQSATCDLTLYGDAIPDIDLSAPVVVEAYGQPRFTGIVTDLAPVQDATTGRQFLAVTCLGPVADLALVPVTPTSWPAETSGARAERILIAAGVTSYRVSGEFDVLALTAKTSSALDLLSALAESTGAAVYTAPDGTVVFQDLLARRQTYVPDVWNTTAGTWSAQSGTWEEQTSKAVADPVVIPLAAIAWQPTLAKHRGNIVNRVSVEYGTGTPRPVVTEDDAVSQAIHQVRPVSISTQLATLAGATQRAENMLERLSYPRWELGGVQVMMHELGTSDRDLVLALECGSRAIINGLPDSYPVRNWMGVVEGWGETYSSDEYGNEYHYLTLALSDPAASYASLTWDEVTTGKTWNTIRAGLIWADATANEALTA